ncbi:MAG: nicotinate phosphoribosyltransferase [Betaproteobacteria bacterium RIFCSPLOWO2_02_FULL_66_14]|nr:MAG: nicotinate phosphoribosyltransferase [Betaproteobacteria bacterium RIFCSPLOWO2_02_FULL_66_14]
MIVRSLLDTDLYKFTMMQVVLHHFPGAQVEYQFRCRTDDADLRPYLDEIRAELANLCTLRFQEEELAYLRSLRFMKSDFVDFLALFQFNHKYIDIRPKPGVGGQIDIAINGPWLHTILYEIPVLAIISEVYFRRKYPEADLAEGRRRLMEKIALVRAVDPELEFKISDFGTRRRFSMPWHEEVISTLKREVPQDFAGTSNVLLAMRTGVLPLGTMAHEYMQACQALGPRLRDSQVFAFDKWAQEYRGDLGIALSDTYGFNAFLRDFDMYFCKLFDGARHDSGDPFDWGERLVAHYQKNRVDPRGKTLIFSDQLSVPLAIEIARRFHGRARTSFGIGTNLTNDMGLGSLNIVIKMTECNGQPVAKVSDAPGKTVSKDAGYLAYLRQVYGLDRTTPAPH